MLITGVGVISWASLPYLDGDVFIAVSFVGRMLQGLGNIFTLVAGFSIAASEYPNDVAKVLAYMETAGGLGLIAGPLIGAGLYYATGFAITFLVYS